VTNEPQHLVVMGVSGSGKTTIAGRLAARLQFTFADGDDFHPAANVEKMARGEPLTDADREPWLSSLAAWTLAQHQAGRSTVLACSALKRRYRDTLRSASPHTFFVHLAAPRAALLERMNHRQGHFMPAFLLDSQLAALEPLASDESGATLDATGPPDTIVEQAIRRVTSGSA
jgi:carbohydrate kinase (thermoresistant glucokinase family)